ncbi:hypothetical protein [Streptomyces spongiae]|uniref:DUF8017 domain-containing protein n=1 Tax=Streptomyces spongiae TaxID=565072 RepID=A0A5N8XXA5_9ACTN|nr:hypothetical protein [Streptomyces spongiae]MPY63902.1 hypothetical protein [Streptomyces spongiae]
MWPGQQQPPGGEQHPQDQNPYQQPGYQQPNPYQQPGYQQPSPYPQQQWGAQAPVGAPRPPGGGGDGNKTKITAVVAATAVVIAAVVTGFLVLGGGEDEEAGGDNGKGNATASASTDPSTPASSDRADDRTDDGEDDSRSAEEEKPTVAGWKVVINPKYGTVFDVPAGWEVGTPGRITGFEWKQDGKTGQISVSAPAYLKPKWCTSDDDKDGTKDQTPLAITGTSGDNGASSTNQAAENRVPLYVYGGYTQPDTKSITYTRAKSYTTKSGLTGSLATAYSANTPQKGKCDSDGKAITFAFKNGSGDFVAWSLFGAKGVDGEVPEATVQKILSTVRLVKD